MLVSIIQRLRCLKVVPLRVFKAISAFAAAATTAALVYCQSLAQYEASPYWCLWQNVNRKRLECKAIRLGLRDFMRFSQSFAARRHGLRGTLARSSDLVSTEWSLRLRDSPDSERRGKKEEKRGEKCSLKVPTTPQKPTARAPKVISF